MSYAVFASCINFIFLFYKSLRIKYCTWPVWKLKHDVNNYFLHQNEQDIANFIQDFPNNISIWLRLYPAVEELKVNNTSAHRKTPELSLYHPGSCFSVCQQRLPADPLLAVYSPCTSPRRRTAHSAVDWPCCQGVKEVRNDKILLLFSSLILQTAKSVPGSSEWSPNSSPESFIADS